MDDGRVDLGGSAEFVGERLSPAEFRQPLEAGVEGPEDPEEDAHDGRSTEPSRAEDTGVRRR